MNAFAIVGMGVQGNKRRRILADAPCVTVDPVVHGVDFKDIREVPLGDYNAAYLCIPDHIKFEAVRYLVAHGKHVLVEKPFTLRDYQYDDIQRGQNVTGVTVYVAYNHRFEPHIAATKKLLDSRAIGDIYTVSLSYGNGTAALVRDSEWRDQGLGVISDLGSHLLDMVDYWWGLQEREVEFIDARAIENLSYDFALCRLTGTPPVWAETTLLSWRNDFQCQIRGSGGSLHISGLCKWGPAELTLRKRIFPSGRPLEETTTLSMPDPTWDAEHDHFLHLIASRHAGNLAVSREISRLLHSLELSLADVK